jgi:hypothetical protein
MNTFFFFYLRSNLDVGLVYDRGNNARGSIEGFVNLNCDCDLDRRRSLAGYVFTQNMQLVEK